MSFVVQKGKCLLFMNVEQFHNVDEQCVFVLSTNFTVDDATVLLCFEASCCSSVSWETMSQFLFTFEASRCTNGIA
jgi:hypothetical protein